jgi:hypothetical protein
MESYQTTPWLADKLMRWSVHLRYTDNPERATIREEELINLLGNLPALFKLPTAGGFLLRALTYRLANHRSHARLAVKRDVFMLSVFYIFNFFAFSAYANLGDMATRPWLLLVWLYGAIILIPLAWRDGAPVVVFIIQWVLTVAAWPILPLFTPMIGIPVALSAVSFRRGRKISLLALLASIIPMGLDAAVAFRAYSIPTQQLQSFIGNAITLALVTAGAWSAGRMNWASQHVQHQTEPRAGQLSLGARFRITVVKAGLVGVCTGTAFGLELMFLTVFSVRALLVFGLGCGVLAAIESVARPSRFYHGLIGGIVLTLFVVVSGVLASAPFGKVGLSALLGGIAFGVATAFTCALAGKFKYIGVIIGTGANLTGCALIVLARSLSSHWVAPIVGFSGIGLTAGVLAGFAAVVERRIRMIDSVPIPVVLPNSLSNPGAINPEPSISIGEPHGKGELS